MKRVVITGLGFITSIGNSKEEVLSSLREGRHGIEKFSAFDKPEIPIKLAGTVKGFTFPSADREDWTYPSGYQISREQMRSMSPNALFGFCAMTQAIQDAQLTPSLVSQPRTSLATASAGSIWMCHETSHTLVTRGAARINPMGIVSGIAGTLSFNLATSFKIKGGAVGYVSACASSAHAIGHAVDAIRLGRQDLVFAVGAEDCDAHTFLPFVPIRALSPSTDPDRYPCAFDKNRDGFVGTGGATVLVLEEKEHAEKRGAQIYAEILGWGESSDGFNVMAPHPEGEGLARCMKNALNDAGVDPQQIDYINAHATSTSAGDLAELRAIKTVFQQHKPWVSSTKSLTGHGLSLAGALEAGICSLALKNKFTPISAKITELDPECEGVSIVREPISAFPQLIMSNSSGFGGSNVSLILRSVS